MWRMANGIDNTSEYRFGHVTGLLTPVLGGGWIECEACEGRIDVYEHPVQIVIYVIRGDILTKPLLSERFGNAWMLGLGK